MKPQLGFCECGCGGKTNIATYTNKRLGYARGRPVRYIMGHNSRQPAARANMRKAMLGRKITWADKISAAQTGSKGNNWQGGRIIRQGRVLLYVGRDHPLADSYGYAYEHRIVANDALGSLAGGDHVHHVDLDPLNNAVGNLVVLTNSEHRRVHNAIGRGALPTDALAVVMER